MDTSDAGVPSAAEKHRFLKKISEWKTQGFETDDLEHLLENDFDEFLRRRHKILKEQLPGKPPITTEEPEHDHDLTHDEAIDEPLTEGELLDAEPGPMSEPEPVSDLGDTDELLLIGEPLTPEDELVPEPEEEGLIVVGKPRKAPQSKVHPSRKVKADEETKAKRIQKKEPSSEPEVEFEAEEEFEDGEEIEPDEEEEFEDEELETEKEKDSRPSKKRVRPPPSEESEGGSVAGRVGSAIVIMIIILGLFYLGTNYDIFNFNGGGGDNNGGGGGNGNDGEVVAAFSISPAMGFSPGTIITFDASNSSGKIIKYSWNLDDDFKITEGSLQKSRLKGYFAITENIEKTKSIQLSVSNSDNDDVLTKSITISPKTFVISEEKLADAGKYQVTGSLDITNPDSIYKFEDDNGSFTIESINMDFRTTDQPMEMMLESSTNMEDGFRQSHVVFKRTITQYLDISGKINGKATIKGDFPLPSTDVSADIEGYMDSNDITYTDGTTHNTIFGKATNKMNINILPITIVGQTGFEGASFTTDDTIESYPDLRKNPMKFRLEDLSDGPLAIGDSDVLPVGNIIYHWHVDKVENHYNNPAIKVNLSIDGITKERYNLKEFFSAFWIAEGISQPVKTHLYTVYENEGNTATLNYISTMTDYTRGVMKLADQTCDLYPADDHFLDRAQDHEYVPSLNWSYLPPTGNSSGGSDSGFSAFPQEQAIAMAKNHQTFINFNSSNADSYIVSGHCTATGEGDVPEGTLLWNLTVGTKNSKNGLNMIITENGTVDSKDVTIDAPPNATSDFDPLLTFAGSEDILRNDFSDKDFSQVIFDGNGIDFDNVDYGIETNLQYPNVEITSIMFVEHSKYAYLVTYDQQVDDQEHLVSVSLDAETGQILFYWDHTDSGFDIFQLF
jgi:hypothetical protein